MDLVKLEKKMPLRGYPEQELNKVLLMDFLPWLCKLLSLTDETSADRLEMALPAIKQQCIGMGFDEIKKMFEKYADGNLSIKPIPNYFDRILLGKIVADYKSTKPKEKKVIEAPKPTPEETEKLIDKQITEMVLHYQNEKEIKPGYLHLYKYLLQRGVLPKQTKEYKENVKKRVAELVRSKKNNATHVDDFRNFQKLVEKKGDIVHMCREIVLLDYLKEVTK